MGVSVYGCSIRYRYQFNAIMSLYNITCVMFTAVNFVRCSEKGISLFLHTCGVTVGHCSVPAELLFEWEGL